MWAPSEENTFSQANPILLSYTLSLETGHSSKPISKLCMLIWSSSHQHHLARLANLWTVLP